MVAEAAQQGVPDTQQQEPVDRFADLTISEEDGSPSAQTQSPGDGKGNPPASEQTAGNTEEGGDKAQTPSGDEAGQENAVDEDALKESLSFTRTPEETQKSLKTQLSAASRESRWNNAAIKEVKSILEGQGLELSIDKVKNDQNEEVPNVALSVKKGYKPEADNFKFDWDSLSDSEREDYLDNPQKLVDTVVDKAQKAYARALPAGEKKPQIAQDNVDAAFEFLGKQTDADGEARYPELGNNKKLVQSMLDDPSMSDPLKALIAKDPETGIELLNARVNNAKQRLLSKAEKAQKAKAAQENQANADASTMPANSGTQREASAGGGDYFAEYV